MQAGRDVRSTNIDPVKRSRCNPSATIEQRSRVNVQAKEVHGSTGRNVGSMEEEIEPVKEANGSTEEEIDPAKGENKQSHDEIDSIPRNTCWLPS